MTDETEMPATPQPLDSAGNPIPTPSESAPPLSTDAAATAAAPSAPIASTPAVSSAPETAGNDNAPQVDVGAGAAASETARTHEGAIGRAIDEVECVLEKGVEEAKELIQEGVAFVEKEID